MDEYELRVASQPLTSGTLGSPVYPHLHHQSLSQERAELNLEYSSLVLDVGQPAEVCAADTSKVASKSSYEDISKLIELVADIAQAVDDGGSRRVA